jgi:hypothetical protein
MREPAVVERGKQGFTNVATSDARHIGVPPQCRHILMRYNDVPSHRRSRADLMLVECLSMEAHCGYVGKHRGSRVLYKNTVYSTPAHTYTYERRAEQRKARHDAYCTRHKGCLGALITGLCIS